MKVRLKIKLGEEFAFVTIDAQIPEEWLKIVHEDFKTEPATTKRMGMKQYIEEAIETDFWIEDINIIEDAPLVELADTAPLKGVASKEASGFDSPEAHQHFNPDDTTK